MWDPTPQYIKRVGSYYPILISCISANVLRLIYLQYHSFRHGGPLSCGNISPILAALTWRTVNQVRE